MTHSARDHFAPGYFSIAFSYGFRTNEIRVGWKNDVQGRERAYAANGWVELPELIVQASERLRGVQIEQRPAVELISRFNSPNVLVCEPCAIVWRWRLIMLITFCSFIELAKVFCQPFHSSKGYEVYRLSNVQRWS